MTEDSTLAVPGPKAPTGIDGFDELTGGGIPRGRITVLNRAKLEELADGAYGLPEAEYETVVARA